MLPEHKDLFYKLQKDAQLSVLLFLEARGEPVDGQIGVGSMVRNRVNEKHIPENSYFLVMTDEKQFSCFNTNDKNYTIGMNMVKELVEGHSPEDLTGMFKQCFWISGGIVNGALLDNTKGAVNYYNPKLCNPVWAYKMVKTCKLGNHVFLK